MNLFKIISVLFLCFFGESNELFNRGLRTILKSGVLDINFLRCYIANSYTCPHPDVAFRIYTPTKRLGTFLDILKPWSLYASGFNKHEETVFIVHGFNGTESDKHMMYLRDAFLGRYYNVITVDWRTLTRYPCYLTALPNTQLTAQCSAQMYSFLTHHGANREKITCVGHSLGAHICGMISNHLTVKQHKIIGLDPARPLIERKKSSNFRLTRDDATIIQVIHTNSGYLGQNDNPGHLNYCVNGGRYQPYCRGHPIRRSRCSHFLSICYLANAMFKHKKFLGVPCPNGCIGLPAANLLPIPEKKLHSLTNFIKPYKIGNDAPDDLHGVYCIQVEFARNCPFNTNE